MNNENKEEIKETISEEVWYDIKEVDGSLVIEKKSKKEKYVPPKEENSVSLNLTAIANTNSASKKKHGFLKFALVFAVILLVFVGIFSASKTVLRNSNKKNRTFMIYMVGSDLESNGSMATFDLKDITGAKIDLNNNNVVLVVGGSKKWHNFVKADEISYYELNSDGFNKIKTMPLANMGSVSSLSKFLDYSYDNYPAEKYDLIFWNHGLGAIGLESDEVSSDYLSIIELDKALKDSPFKNEKLELVIFNNCLAGNFHFAEIMSKYAEYMVGSEEVMYVAATIDRLNFLKDVKVNDNGYDIGLYYIKQSDESISKMNKMFGYTKLDSTLSIIDLAKINSIETKLNEFFKSIDLKSDYYSISRARMRTYTYAKSVNYVYDTVDLYGLVEALAPYSNNNSIIESLKSDIKGAVKYNSSLNSYSNGLSIYFPYYGNSDYVELHLLLFDSLWKNEYTNFIESFYNRATSTKRARRAVTGSEINYLVNDAEAYNKRVAISLTDEEKAIFQKANIYVFEKEDDAYKLLLKSTNVNLDESQLVFNHYGLLTTESGSYITLIDDDNYKVYGTLDNYDIISDLKIENNNVTFEDAIIYKEELPISGFVDIEADSDLSLYSYRYVLENNGELKEDWKESLEKEKTEIENKDSGLNIVENGLSGYYILIEMYDNNNDVFYSKLTKVN